MTKPHHCPACTAEELEARDRICAALDVIEATGWTAEQLADVASVLESVASEAAASVPGFRPYIVK